MPNTLAHIALQSAFLWGARKRIAIFPLILLGAVIPDVAWIIQRVASSVSPTIDHYDLRAYAVVQASLFLSLILAAGCASLFRRWAVSFAVLAAGCVLHLVLDGLQIKWANGVSLLAPFDWRLSTAGFVWPEHPMTHVVTAVGVFVILLGFRRLRTDAETLTFAPRRLAAAVVLTAIYATLPLLLLSGPKDADNHYVTTLQHLAARPGKPIELDRRPVFKADGDWFVRTFAGEAIRLSNMTPPREGTYSIRGRFLTGSLIDVQEFHAHTKGRDIASIIGLGLTGAWFFVATVSRRKQAPLSSSAKP